MSSSCFQEIYNVTVKENIKKTYKKANKKARQGSKTWKGRHRLNLCRKFKASYFFFLKKTKQM